MLNPDNFESLDDFLKALKEEGLKQGWTQMFDVAPIKLLRDTITQGSIFVKDFLAHHK